MKKNNNELHLPCVFLPVCECVWRLGNGVSNCVCQQEQLCLFTHKGREEGEEKGGGVENRPSFIAC